MNYLRCSEKKRPLNSLHTSPETAPSTCYPTPCRPHVRSTLSPYRSHAMEDYIKEALAVGYIWLLTSLAATGNFFVKKKNGGLRPCINYRGLNALMVRYAYPLPLVPAALEQLRGAWVFTKLDLCRAYNLLRIREEDECKTAFHTTREHYEYLVMSYGLANAPVVFQAFINKIIKDLLNHLPTSHHHLLRQHLDLLWLL
ncbi:hypothetical protein QTP70_011774 [Hemibagrus guttatus]|uniref:ribonuclease H n=1 Tax=Hemibagrus guttatus TaxID=175788 RepID=A0AAE0QL48_9TELE|nr:hypothetical protein QTP70_011774 [Hemibagrus guttatus]KAK3557946.1 hypothetical protein QTP86_003873 [Hemibagrus guttatus]